MASKYMGSNIPEYSYFGADLQLSEPHFDEEATLLSARPVVPLGDVPPQERPRRRLAFGLAVIVAAMAGAFGTTLIYQRVNERQATGIEDKGAPLPERPITSGQPLLGTAGATSDAQSGSAAENVPNADAHNKTAPSQISRSVSGTKESAPRLSQSVKSASANETIQDETIQDSDDTWRDEREARRAERIEERRLRRDVRREAKRDPRGQDHRRSSDDLLRIREIFEGAPRP